MLRRLARLALERDYRYAALVRRGWIREAFQADANTREDRYPAIFDFVQSSLGEATAAALLSFGCSTGEEVFSLRDRFPNATVRGLEINPGRIDICRRRLGERRLTGVSFARAGSTSAEPTGRYDGIFCMAVLRDGRLEPARPPSCSPLIRFERFARLVDDFHRCLKPGGLLVIRHSNFRLRDAPVGAKFETLLSQPGPLLSLTPIYGPDNALMPDLTYPDTVFRKIAA